MNKILLTFGFALIFLPYSFSQIEVKGKVHDQETFETLPYVNVGILQTIIGDISDAKGTFKLMVPDSLRNANLTVHSPGYELMQVSIDQLLNKEAKLFLKPTNIALSEVLISQKSKAYKSTEIEIKEKLSRKGSVALSQSTSGGSAIAVRYQSPTKGGFWLDDIKLKIEQNLGDTINLRIRLLKVSEDGKPGMDLYPTDTIVSTTMENGWWSVDLKEEHILIDEPYFFVCFELIEDLETRIKLNKKREEKTKLMYDLYDRGVKKIEIQTDSIEGEVIRTGWSSSMSKREAKQYGVDFPTGKAYFTITPNQYFPTYKKVSSFDNWQPLFEHEFTLVSGITVSFDPEATNTVTKTETENNFGSYPLVWGHHLVGFIKFFEVDTSRYYKAPFYEDGTKVADNTFRPIQINVWYPTNKQTVPLNLIDYIRTLAWTEQKIPLSQEVDQALINSLSKFGFPLDYAKQTSNAQLNVDFSDGSYPLLLYTPGLSSEAIENYKLCELLASFGYVVVAIPSLGTLGREMEPNIEQTITQLADIDFALTWAKDKLPVNDQLGLLGYSWGALSNLAYAFNGNHTVDAMISLDGSMYTQTDLLTALIGAKKLREGKSAFIGTRPLDKDVFKYYNHIEAYKSYYQTRHLQHDNFIALGNDLASSTADLRKAYTELCALVVQLYNAYFSGSETAKINFNPIYIHQLD